MEEAMEIFPELGIGREDVEAVRSDASFLEDLATYLDGEVAELRAGVEGYVPVVEREIPVQPSPGALPEQVTPEMAEFFNRFDGDKNNKLSIGEAMDFFFWVENNIRYRYDNEEELNPIVGFIGGDGKPGGDYRQTPLETLNEGYGDCEDMATLEAAFYRFYGIDAYVVVGGQRLGAWGAGSRRGHSLDS